MIKTQFLLLFMISFLTITVFTQYQSNDGYYQRDRDTNPSIGYLNNQLSAYNQAHIRSYQSEYKEKSMPYQFQYDIDDGYGNKQDRQERADRNGNVFGSYGFVDSNGIYRKVDYTAGPEGFVAKINSNEPYLENNANPANVEFIVEDPPYRAIDYVKRQSNRHLRHQSIEDNYEDFNDNQMIDQLYRASDDLDKRYDNRLEFIQPLIAMLKPLNRRNPNQDFYQTINSNRNFADIKAFGSDRRYYD